MGKAQDFGTTSNTYQVNRATVFDTADDHSFQMWIKPVSGSATMQPVSVRATTTTNTVRDLFGIQTVNPSQVRYFTFATGTTSAYLFFQSTDTFTAGSWNYLYVERNGSNIKTAINSNTPETGTISSPRTYTTSNARQGAGQNLTGGGPGETYGGNIDEMRLRISLLSNNWITTEYNNQNSPSTFYSVAAVAGSSAAQAARRGAVMMM